MLSKNLGILLIVSGIIMMSYSGYHFLIAKEILPADSIEIKKNSSSPIQWIPITGIILIISGIMTIEKSKSKN